MILTIVIPTLNAETRIGIALSSIEQQGFKDFEVIIVDGGSRDATISVVKQRADRMRRLHIIECCGADIYQAMNIGIERASGEWVYFMGADDELNTSGTLAEISCLLCKSIDMVYGDIWIAETGQRNGGRRSIKQIFQRTICHQAVFIKTSVIKKLGGYNPRYRLAADYEMVLKVMLDASWRVIYTDTVIARYSVEGLSGRKRDDLFDSEKEELIANILVGASKLHPEYRIYIAFAIYLYRIEKRALAIRLIKRLLGVRPEASD